MKQMNRILFALILTVSVRARADVTTASPAPAVPWAPATENIQIVKDNQYIYLRQPVHVLFNHGQSEALKKATTLVTTQLANLVHSYDPASDPNGDLAALVEGLNGFRGKVGQLIDYASSVYGEVDAEKAQWLPWLGEQADPTGFILFATVEGTKNVLSWLPIPGLSSLVQGGGSLTAGIVFVPMRVTRIPIDNNAAPETYSDWDKAFIVIPNANAGAGVSATAEDMNARAGIALIWGQLNRASDLVGLTGGGSATVDYPEFAKIFPSALQSGVNFKLLGLKNWSRPGIIDNVIAMFGLEGGQTPTWNATTPALKLKAQAHFNISYILDAKEVFSGISSASQGILNKISGSSEPSKTSTVAVPAPAGAGSPSR